MSDYTAQNPKPPTQTVAMLSFIRAAFFVALGTLIIMTWDIIDGVPLMADIDDGVRKAQINDLLADGNWYDRSLPGVIDYKSHWSRLVDAPYYILTKGLNFFLPSETAALWARRLVPLGLLIALIGFFTAIIQRISRLADQEQPPMAAFVAAAAMALVSLLEFVPSRIDHHNFQILCVVIMIWGLLPRKEPYEPESHKPNHGGIAAGGAILVSLSIGLETLPLILAFLSILVVTAAMGMMRTQTLCRQIGLTLCLVTAPFSIATLGVTDTVAAHCDAISAPWIIALTLGGFWLWLGTRIWSNPEHQAPRRHGSPSLTTTAKRICIFGVGSAVILAITLWLYPKCLGGPFEMASPLARRLWLDGFSQEKSLFTVFWLTGYGAYIGFVFFYLCLSATLIFVLAPSFKRWPDAIKIVSALVLLSVVFMIIQIRHIRLTAILVCLFIPITITQYQHHKPEIIARLMRKRTALCVLPLAVMIAAYQLTPKPAEYETAHDITRWDGCYNADFSVLETLPRGRIIMTMGLSQTLFERSVPHDLAAIQYQRSAKGIDDILTVFFTDDDRAVKDVLARYDYLAICRINTGLPLSDSPIFAALNKGDDWPGLSAIKNPVLSRFQLYKIEKNAKINLP